jgi:hypothetical protein
MSQMKKQMSIIALTGILSVSLSLSLKSADDSNARAPTDITINSQVPSELNPTNGGAPNATPDQAAAFAWQEFIALNWPAGPQNGQPNQRDTPSSTSRFGDPNYSGPTTWETFRGKVEIFPGNGNVMPPPGYPGPHGDVSYGYDALPRYNYNVTVSPADPGQATDPTPWVNLDETDQIGLDNMYAGVVAPGSSPGNSSPQLIRFLAKANRSQYVYVAGNSSASNTTNQWWFAIPSDVVSATKAYLVNNQASPPAGSNTLVSLPNGTIEIKAGWRPLNPSEAASGRFHTQTVRFYENPSGDSLNYTYRNATWGLVALHIIQKTPSAPYFIYATFEQADNILTADGRPVEDVDGRIILKPEPPTATSPQVSLLDPQPLPTPPPPGGELVSTMGSVVLSEDPATGKPQTYCGAPGSHLYYHNDTGNPPNSAPSKGTICVEKRDNAIPDYVINGNAQAHAAIAAYLKQSGIVSAPWLYYKLINVQYYPYDKVITTVTPNGSLYQAKPPYNARNPAPSSFYQANIVVETNRSLQLFSGGLSPYICSDWNQDGTPHKNTIYNGHSYNMGGCMGCHGSQGQTPGGLHLHPEDPVGQAGDFSVILARGAVITPEAPRLTTSQGLTPERRNRTINNR